MMLVTPAWMRTASNLGAVVVVVGGLYLAVQVIHRLRTRVTPRPLPTLAQLADSARRAALQLTADTAAGRAPVAEAPTRPVRSILGGTAPSDPALLAARTALGLGRWADARHALADAARDTANASAALGASLLAAWRLDEPGARSALARAERGRASLTPPERLLLEAHARWLDGDVRGSDSVFRTLLLDERDDPTLWYAAAFVHRHDGGYIDSALVAFGSPAARRLTQQPARRVSHGGAVHALWRVLQLSPQHEAARLELLRFAALHGQRPLADRLAWGAELSPVEPETRLAMRVLSADARRDTSAWAIALRLALDAAEPGHVLHAARALATAPGVLDPLSLWRAAELLQPLTDATRHPPQLVATAHAWRGQMLVALRRPVSTLAEFHAAAAIDPAIGLPLAAWAVWLSPTLDDSTRLSARETLQAWNAAVGPTATRDWLQPHAGMEPHLKAYAIGLLSATLGDTVSVASQARALAALPPIAGDSTLARIMADALRGEVALARNDFAAAIALTALAGERVPPLWREHSPFTARAHPRYRRAYAQMRAWENERARIGFVRFFSPTLPELALYRFARARFDATP